MKIGLLRLVTKPGLGHEIDFGLIEKKKMAVLK